MPLKRQPVGVKRREPEVLSCTLSCETPLPLIRHPLSLSLGHLTRSHGEWRARERDRERFHLIDKEFFLQVVLNLASQPLTPMWMRNALAGTLKRAIGQGRGLGLLTNNELFKEAADYAEVQRLF